MLALAFSGCKDDDPSLPQPEPTSYTVYYSLSIFGGYNDLQMSYFSAGNSKIFKSNPKLPWEETISNFNILDSVALRAAILPIPNKTVSIEYSINITKGSGYSNLNTFTDTITAGSNPDTLYFNFVDRID